MLADVAGLGIFRNMYELSLVVKSSSRVTSVVQNGGASSRRPRSLRRKHPRKRRKRQILQTITTISGVMFVTERTQSKCSDTDCPLSNNISGKLSCWVYVLFLYSPGTCVTIFSIGGLPTAKEIAPKVAYDHHTIHVKLFSAQSRPLIK